MNEIEKKSDEIEKEKDYLSRVKKGVRRSKEKAKEKTKKWGSMAKDVGVRPIVQRLVAGFFTTRLKQLRADQLHTLLESGAFIADLIDENNPPETIGAPINLALVFMSKEKIIRALDDLITPRLVMEMLQVGAPETHKQIVERPGAGEKWFYWQTEDLKRKLRRMILKW